MKNGVVSQEENTTSYGLFFQAIWGRTGQQACIVGKGNQRQDFHYHEASLNRFFIHPYGQTNPCAVDQKKEALM